MSDKPDEMEQSLVPALSMNLLTQHFGPSTYGKSPGICWKVAADPTASAQLMSCRPSNFAILQTLGLHQLIWTHSPAGRTADQLSAEPGHLAWWGACAQA